MRRAVFLDLNGTLVMPILVEHLSELTPLDGALAAISALTAAGFICPVVTIQSRIAKGLFSAEEFQTWFSGFAANLGSQGASVVGPYVCPHRFAEPCPCKKPSPLLYERAAAEHGIDLARSFVIGDSAADVEAAHRFGGRGCLVQTGWGANKPEQERAAPYAAHVAPSITEAATWVLSQSD